MFLSSARSLRYLGLASAAGLSLLVTGCGLGTQATTSSSSALQGMVHGGPNPVTGATVTLWATGTGSYGAASTSLGTALTKSDGSFQFVGATPCVSPQQEYITVSGGNPGSGTNNNYLLMAALGDCSTVTTSSVIWIDEVTTVAAAYALSNFISITGSTVNIGAPTTNAAATGTCTGTGAALICTAAGLPHAFSNAINLASSIGTASAPPTGAAFVNTPSNAQGYVPYTLINALANSIEVCVNSTGGVATDTSTACGKLFSYATPPTTGAAAPTNTLQAMVNIAKYPANNVANIFNLPTGFNTYYLPALTAAPHDFSLGVFYKGVTIGTTTTTFGYPYFLSLDANDQVYAMTQPSSSGTPVTAVALGSNGSPVWVSGSINTTACAAGVPCVSAPDAAGTLWTVTGTTSAGKLTPVSTSTGTVGTAVTQSSTAFFGVAIDKANNVFLSVPTATAASSFYELASGGTALTAVQANGANVSSAAVPAWIWFDSNANLWSADKYTAATTSVVTELPSTAGVFGTPVTQTVDSAVADGGLYGLVTDSNGVAYANNAANLMIIPAGNATAPTPVKITNGTVTAASARYSTIDGSGNIYFPDNNGTAASYLWQYSPATSSFNALLPCASATGTTTCSVTAATEVMDGPRNAAVDSTGSIWIASSTNGNVVQIIGTAAPAWGQLSYLKPGVKP